jgi:sodium-coupled neutral amino acid transporter 11
VRHFLITFFLVASTVVVGLTTCELGMILELGGGLGGSFIAFIIPGGLWIKANKIAGMFFGDDSDCI